MNKEEKLLIELGKRLRKIREKRGWTLEETEDHGWPSWRHLQQIETGKKNISITTVFKLANLYKTPVHLLLKGL